MKNKSQKTRLKRRIHAYRTLGTNFVYMLESNFKGVFSPKMVEKGIEESEGFGRALDELIDICSEEECLELNLKLDCYQIENEQERG